MRLTILAAALAATLSAQDFTRGPGNYPGAPAEYAGPSLRPTAGTPRNLALHRAAYQSSAWDYNLTAQLVTDGIRESVAPPRLTVTTSDRGVLPPVEREMMFDANYVTAVEIKGRRAWIQLDFAGGTTPPEIDQIELDASVRAAEQDWQNWTVVVSGSADATAWTELRRLDGMARPTGELKATLTKIGAHHRFLRIEFLSGRELTWHIGDIGFSHRGQPVLIAGPFNFSSAWASASGGDQWVYVDLGVKCTFDRLALYWLKAPARGSIQVSDNATVWIPIQELPAAGAVPAITLAKPTTARYVRVTMAGNAATNPYILSELEVYGTGGPQVDPKPAPAPAADGAIRLTGGAWKLERASQVAVDGAALSQPGFDDSAWLVATVPATTLVSYLNAGAIPDPNFGDNQLAVSDSFFYSDFWYRDEFVAPAVPAGKHRFLNFDGINWKAEVYLNGQKLGRIEGGFIRAHFDVTAILRPGEKNALAVRIEKNRTPGNFKEKTFNSPGSNGGALGADNPTFHASIGWDWIPTIHGRDTGIWNEVSLSTTGGVTLDNPFVHTRLPLPDTSRAEVFVEATLTNHEATPVTGVLRGKFGDVAFEQPVTIAANASQLVKLSPSTHPQLRLTQPKLWWPTGYGDQHLYPVELSFAAGDQVSDVRRFQSAVRQFTYSEEGGILRMWINGRRFIPKGGNWGFAESMLRYRAREYDAAIRYHHEMHFNIIRNWVGQIGEDAFYEACDKWGIVVWQDFWLANPWDGPNPDDNAMFAANARDLVERMRNHPSIGLYCGRNEGYPPLEIETGLRRTLAELHPGMIYIPSSADDSVSGHGPYQVMPLKYYFTERATTRMHSELGMPNIVTMDSLRLMMKPADMWPQGRVWGIHDFSLNGAQGGRSFISQIEKSYGGAKSAEEWVSLAQFVNYEGHRAMFEAQSQHRQGLVMWMSHPTWPSMVWQTYDYFLHPTAGYFAVRKAAEPLHIQWNPVSNKVEVVNYSAGTQKGVTAQAEVLSLTGAVVWQKSATLDSAEDSVASPIAMEFPAGLSAVHFVRLKLVRGGQTLSENFYWRGTEENNYRALRDLPKVRVQATTKVEQKGNRWLLTTELTNTGKSPALMVTVKAVRSTTRERIVPAIYSDNYVALMPGEKKTIATDLDNTDSAGIRPAIAVEGFNVEAVP